MPVTAPRMDASRRLTLAAAAAIALCPAFAFAQTTTTAPATQSSSSLLLPATRPAATAMPELAAVTQPFVGAITTDKVYVRSGPGSAYYELGQLAKGDLVQVVGSRQGWYQILPPNGTFCMVAKELAEIDPSGATGIVKADYVNVRAGTALNKNREPSVVLTVIRKGAKLTILGSTDKYYEIAPPEKAYVYVSPQFVRAESNADYRVPELKLPAGVTGPAKTTVTAPTTLPASTVDISPVTPADAHATGGSPANTPTAQSETPAGPASATVVVPPQPATTFSNDSYARFSELNKRYQDELRKPPLDRDIDGLLKEYKSLAGTNGLPPSVEQGTQSRITALEKLAAIQRLTRENATATSALAERQHALQQQYSSAEQAIRDYEQTGPYVAEGRLQASTAIQGKYALVNPSTGRVVAYVDPQADVDIGSLMGKYIGVRGASHKAEGSEVTVITVKNATLLPAPSGSDATR